MGRRAQQGQVFRRVVARVGQGLTSEIGRAMVAAFNMGDLVPVSLADKSNSWTDDPRECVGEVIAMGQEPDGSVWADLDIRRPDTASDIRAGTMLGTSPVLRRSDGSVTGLMISNRVPAGSAVGFQPVAASGSRRGDDLVMLTSASEEPFMIVGQQDEVQLAAGPDPFEVWADAEADDIAARHASGASGFMFADGHRHHAVYRGQPRPPAALSADIDGTVFELAASHGVFPYQVEDALAERSEFGSVMLTPADKIAALREVVALTAAPEDEVMLTAGPATGAEVASAVQSEILRLSAKAEGIALAAARRGHAPGHSAGSGHSVAPHLGAGSPPHEPFFGMHDHEHDHPSHSHDYTHSDHGHRHVHADGSPIPIVDDGWSGGPSGHGSGPAGMSAGYPGAGMAGQHHHPAHSHPHHHGHDSGVPESSHAHHHAEEPAGLESGPGSWGGMSSPADAEVARITGQNPHLGFAGGQVKGRSYVYTEPNNESATDHRQPREGGQIHPGVAEVLARNREIFEPAGPLTELRQQRSRTLLGPLGKPAR